MSLGCKLTSKSIKLGVLRVINSLIDEIKEGQKVDPFLLSQVEKLNQGVESEFRFEMDRVMRFKDRLCIPSVSELKGAILEEGHRSSLSIHPRAIKIYQGLKKVFWWSKTKKEVQKFVYACLVYYPYFATGLRARVINAGRPRTTSCLVSARYLSKSQLKPGIPPQTGSLI